MTLPLASLRSPRFGYAVGWNPVDGWFFERARGRRVERFALDHDRRHARLFLSERDQARVGLEGLVALERLARAVLPGQR